MVRKALLIGINYKGSSAALHGCINDVKNVKQFLLNERGFQESEIRVMTEEATNPKDIPTKANILEGFEWLMEENSSNSNLFLHYSGHGSQIYDRNSEEIDRRDETIIPVDYLKSGQIVDDELRKILVEKLDPGAELFFLCDCCHSASMLDLKYCYKVLATANQTAYSIIADKNYRKTESKIISISGCLDNQTSADAFINRQSQGAMTHSFLKAYEILKKQGKGVTYKNLMKNVLSCIKQKGFNQIPQLYSGKFLDLGETFTLG